MAEQSTKKFGEASLKCRQCGGTFTFDLFKRPQNRVCPHCQHENKEQSIELDCPPGNPRPGDLIAGVIKGTILPLRDDVSRLFGNWKWDYDDIPEEQWKKALPVLKERIEKLYNQCVIRYASW